MKANLLISSDEFFSDIVQEGLNRRKVKTYPLVQSYLTELLKSFLNVEKLKQDEFSDENSDRKQLTLAEMLMIAQNTEDLTRKRLRLKNLADRTLYLSGFFGDSLQRKIIDIDYYVLMGGQAYQNLAHITHEDMLCKVYDTISQRFVEFVDVFTYISQNSLIHNNQSVLRLYDRYLKTGSTLAKEKLIEMGVLILPDSQVKLGKQN